MRKSYKRFMCTYLCDLVRGEKIMKKSFVSIATIVLLFLTTPEAFSGNRSDCHDWCNSHRDVCEFCSKRVGCGRGYTALKHFRGRGKNYHACGKTTSREGAERNLSDCRNWCNSHRDVCEFCSSRSGCGRGYMAIKHFRGRGKNYHACGKR